MGFSVEVLGVFPLLRAPLASGAFAAQHVPARPLSLVSSKRSLSLETTPYYGRHI